jgi:hypothetical protein
VPQRTNVSWKRLRPRSADEQEVAIVLVLGTLALVLMFASIWVSLG